MVRLSLGGYSNESDIDAAVSGIEQVVAGEYIGQYRADIDGSFHPLGYVEPMLFSLDACATSPDPLNQPKALFRILNAEVLDL